jgi:glycosyltransferase involved in cell wall biosynthesis
MGGTNIRVAHVLGSLIYGGVQTTALNLVRGLAKLSFRQLVVYQGSNAGDMYPEFASLTEVLHCPYRKDRRLRFVRALSRLLRDKSVDVVLSHSFGNHALVAMAAKLAGVAKTYVIVQNDPVSRGLPFLRRFALAHGARPICQGEIAVSESVARTLVDRLCLPARRVTVIPNGCDIEQVARRASQARATAVRGPEWRILMASRMARPKDHPTLLRAVALLRAKSHPVELILAGDGALRAEHEAFARRLGISDCVHFLGNRPDIPELMGTSDVLVLATGNEGLPIVLLEGMAAGIPIVATDIPACREALEGGKCGVLAPGRDPEALATALEDVLQHPRRREELVRAASQRVRDHYDLPLMVERYAELLRGG